MLNAKRESLAGKLLLSSALVAVSLAYGWWQRPAAPGPAIAMVPMTPPAAVAPVPQNPAPAGPATDDAASKSHVEAAPTQTAAAGPPESLAIARRQPIAPAPAPTAAPAPPQTAESSPPVPTLTPQQALQMNLPTEGVSPALAMVTGNPDPGAAAQIPAGTHLLDGDYVSGRHELAWGDLRIRISIHGGQITGVQALAFPDHRSQSLYLSQMALPILESEAIKSQKAQVDTVSSATDTSYTFQDAMADAIVSATRE